ncbi:MAG: hypothetical protein FWC92_08810 [Defluviitaleaceae bacterium]|nr:hypothetical protein [Defluviitaleaceae bacterium]
MKKRISTRAICLVIAAVMLIGALTVSAINGSPYENLKNAAINALFYENYSVEGEFVIRVDGQVLEQSSIRNYVDSESMLSMVSNREGGYRISYTTPDFRLNPITFRQSDELYDDNVVQWHFAQRAQPGQNLMHNSVGYVMFGQAGRDSNYLRLAELAIDLFVGDLKNNLTMSAQGDDIRRISGAITESQLPEAVRLIINIAIDEQLRWADTSRAREDFNHTLEVPIRDLAIDRIQGHADIDGYGNLLYVSFLGRATIENILGDTHVVEVEGALRFFDIGTTVPVNPFEGAQEILEEYFGRMHNQVFFTLDEDGNIDLASITNRWPTDVQHIRQALGQDESSKTRVYP